MKTLIIGFSHPIKPTLFSRAIKWAEGTIYDHVYIKWTWTQVERDIIYQASHLAVNFESNITFDSHAITDEAYEVNISDDTYKAIMQFCMDNSDKPYGVLEILGFAYMKLMANMRYTVNNPFPSYGSAFVCSQLVFDICKQAGIIMSDVSCCNVDPLLLNQIIKQAGLKRIL